MNHASRLAVLAALVLLQLSAPAAWGVIQRLTPLASLLNDADSVLITKVEKLDSNRPAAVLLVTEVLKGKDNVKRYPIALGNEKPQETAQLLERLSVDASLVLFVTQLGNKQLTLAFANGTWFQVIGQSDGQQVRWSFTHLEPYLRRTFKGTTDELRQVLADAIAGRQKPPGPNPKESPGLGPPVKKLE